MKLDSGVMEKVLLVAGGVAIGFAFREEIREALEELENVELGPIVQRVIESEMEGV